MNAATEDSKQYNICLLNRIIPYICGKADYNVRFCYGDTSALHTVSPLSCVLISEEFVFTFDENLKKGILYQNEPIRRFWMEVFEEQNARAESFLTRHESMLDAVKFYQNQHPCDVSCQLQPCLAYALSGELLHQVVLPSLLGQQDIIEEFIEMMGSWGEYAVRNKASANINYFLASGVDDFLKTGRVAEFPSGFYSPIPVPMRRRMLELFCEQMEKGMIDGHLINEMEFTIDSSLVIQICGKDAVHFIYCQPDGSQVIMRVTENSIVEAFRGFLMGLKDSDNVCTKEETIAFIRKKLENIS